MSTLRLVLAGAALALLGLVPVPAEAKSYVFSQVSIEATVGPDGSLSIVEARTFRFRGKFTWATYRLPLRGTTGARDIRVSDERGAYTPSAERGVDTPSEPPVPGTYQVTRDYDQVVIRWAFSAADESRTFTIAYVLDDVVTVYDDVAELVWKFVETGWDRPSEVVRVVVRLPGRPSADQIQVWVHGPLHGSARPTTGGAVLEIRDLPAATMVEGRIVFPREAVPQARVRRSEIALPRILQEERQWAEQANRERLRSRATVGGLFGLPVLTIGLWVLLYLRYGREPVPHAPEGYYRDLPAAYTPAELGVLWRFGSVQPADFVATVLDLVRRGFITVERGGILEDTFTLTRTDKTVDLRPFEAEALGLLFGKGARPGKRIVVERRLGPPEEVKKRLSARFAAWARMLVREAEEHGFFDPASMRVRELALVLGLVLLVGGFLAAGGLGFVAFPWRLLGGFATALGGGIMLAGSGALVRRSQRGADDLRRWQGFRRFLLDFSEMRGAELPSLTLWEHYLVYAVPLGVADRVIAQLRAIYPAAEIAQSPGVRVWTGGTMGGRGGDPLASLGAFTTVLTAATSSATSSSGRGGGFSGGGGRGGGGSGGSAG